MNTEKKLGFATRQIHAGKVENAAGSLCAPIYQTSTFAFSTVEQGGARFAGQEGGYIYTRLGNPSLAAVEAKLASLEGGVAAMAAASGMGAISSALWSAVVGGDEIVADETLYGCTYALLNHGMSKFGVKVTLTDLSDIENLKKNLTDKTKVVYFETPCNPTLKLLDIELIAKTAHAFNPDIRVIVDNTFCTPYLQQPLDQGADIVIHSATKYLAGHSEVNAGLVVVKDDELGKRVYFAQNRLGGVLAPNECDSVRRGIQTLALRMDRQQENARAISSYLLLHPLVKSVHYPGLPGHEYELASNGLKGGGAVLSFEVVPGVDPADVLDNLHIFRLAVSLGAVESLAELPCRMTHFELPREERLKVGITDELVRLAVGVEDKQDLIEDLGQAFDIAYEHYLNRHAGESLFTFAQHVYA